MLRGSAEVHRHALEHLRLHGTGAPEQCVVVRDDPLQGLVNGFDTVLAVVGEMGDPRQKGQRRRMLDDQRAAVDAGGAAVQDHTRHAGEAAVVDGGIQHALQNQPLRREVLQDRGLRGWRGRPGPGQARRRPAPAEHRPLHADLHVQRLPRRCYEPLHHHVVGPGREELACPLAAGVRPVHLELGALEIGGAQVVRDGFGTRRLDPHREGQATEPAHARGHGRLAPFGDGEPGGVLVLPVENELSHLRKHARDVGRLERPLAWREQTLVAKDDRLRVRVTRRLDAHRPVARDQQRVGSRREAAEAVTRHHPSADTLRERHRRDGHVTRPYGLAEDGRLGEQPILPDAAQVRS